MIFSLIFVLQKHDIPANCEKPRKYGIYVERFYQMFFFMQCIYFLYRANKKLLKRDITIL